MRKTILVLLVIAMLTSILTVSASAAEPRMVTAVNTLNIEGTTATCSLRATGNNTSEYMVANIYLYRDNTCIQRWTKYGYGYILCSLDKTITLGHTYRMSVDLTVNGEDFPVADVYKTV